MSTINKAALIEQAAKAMHDAQGDWTFEQLCAEEPAWANGWRDNARAVLPTVATPLLAPLRELHQRVGVYEDADRCNCPDRDIHEIGYSEDGDELCLNSPCPDEGFHCAECYDEFGEAMPYPCETVRLLDAIEAEVTA